MHTLQNIILENELPAKLWNTGRDISRLFLTGDHWLLTFMRPCSAPIDRLPYDVLAEIFLYCLCHDSFRPLSECGRLRVEPLTLSHVSSRWRTVAISKASLWASIWVDRPREPHVPMVELWLERSRGHPLVLYLRQTPPVPSGQPPHPFTDPKEYELTEKIIQHLKNHLHRWKRVTFLFAKQEQRSLLYLPDVSTAAPLLEHIHMMNTSWSADSKLKMERIMYSYAAVTSVVLHPYMGQEFVPWRRLTVIDANLQACPTSNLLSVLKLCTSLKRAEFCITADSNDAPFIRPAHRVRVPHLSSLTLALDRVDLAPLLDSLLLPALEGLVLRYSRAPRRANDPQALHHLLLRSGCTLRRFSMRDEPRARDGAHHLAYLRAPQMAALQELFLQVDLTDEIIRFLTLADPADADADAPRHLPDLQTVSLRDVDGEHIDGLELYRFVASRLAAGPLRAVFFHLRVQGHSTSPVLPLLLERCRERIQLRVYLAPCEDPHAAVGWYTSPPIPGGYLVEA